MAEKQGFVVFWWCS